MSLQFTPADSTGEIIDITRGLETPAQPLPPPSGGLSGFTTLDLPESSPNLYSNPTRIRAEVADWAEQGNNNPIPADKLTMAPSGGGGGGGGIGNISSLTEITDLNANTDFFPVSDSSDNNAAKKVDLTTIRAELNIPDRFTQQTDTPSNYGTAGQVLTSTGSALAWEDVITSSQYQLPNDLEDLSTHMSVEYGAGGVVTDSRITAYADTSFTAGSIVPDNNLASGILPHNADTFGTVFNPAQNAALGEPALLTEQTYGINSSVTFGALVIALRLNLAVVRENVTTPVIGFGRAGSTNSESDVLSLTRTGNNVTLRGPRLSGRVQEIDFTPSGGYDKNFAVTDNLVVELVCFQTSTNHLSMRLGAVKQDTNGQPVRSVKYDRFDTLIDWSHYDFNRIVITGGNAGQTSSHPISNVKIIAWNEALEGITSTFTHDEINDTLRAWQLLLGWYREQNDTDTFNIRGTVEASRFVGDGSGLTNLPITGAETFRGAFDASGGNYPTGTHTTGDVWRTSVAGTITVSGVSQRFEVNDYLEYIEDNNGNAVWLHFDRTQAPAAWASITGKPTSFPPDINSLPNRTIATDDPDSADQVAYYDVSEGRNEKSSVSILVREGMQANNLDQISDVPTPPSSDAYLKWNDSASSHIYTDPLEDIQRKPALTASQIEDGDEIPLVDKSDNNKIKKADLVEAHKALLMNTGGTVSGVLDDGEVNILDRQNQVTYHRTIAQLKTVFGGSGGSTPAEAQPVIKARWAGGGDPRQARYSTPAATLYDGATLLSGSLPSGLTIDANTGEVTDNRALARNEVWFNWNDDIDFTQFYGRTVFTNNPGTGSIGLREGMSVRFYVGSQNARDSGNTGLRINIFSTGSNSTVNGDVWIQRLDNNQYLNASGNWQSGLALLAATGQLKTDINFDGSDNLLECIIFKNFIDIRVNGNDLLSVNMSSIPDISGDNFGILLQSEGSRRANAPRSVKSIHIQDLTLFNITSSAGESRFNINSLTAATPTDTDEFTFADSSDGNQAKKVTGAALRTFIGSAGNTPTFDINALPSATNSVGTDDLAIYDRSQSRAERITVTTLFNNRVISDIGDVPVPPAGAAGALRVLGRNAGNTTNEWRELLGVTAGGSNGQVLTRVGASGYDWADATIDISGDHTALTETLNGSDQLLLENASTDTNQSLSIQKLFTDGLNQFNLSALANVPAIGTAGQILAVNTNATGHEYIDAPSGGGTQVGFVDVSVSQTAPPSGTQTTLTLDNQTTWGQIATISLIVEATSEFSSSTWRRTPTLWRQLVTFSPQSMITNSNNDINVGLGSGGAPNIVLRFQDSGTMQAGTRSARFILVNGDSNGGGIAIPTAQYNISDVKALKIG